MAKLIVCRLCLSQNVHMYNIENTVLQEIYEKLANIRVASDGSSQMGMACYICYSLLQKSHRLQQQCNTANNELVQLSQECQVETTKRIPHRVDRDSYKWKHGLQNSEMLITDSTALSSENSHTLNNIKKEETIEYEDSVPDGVEGTPRPAKRLNLPETYEQQSEDTFDKSILQSDKSQESNTPNEKNCVEPANHVFNKTTVNDKIIDSESMLQIVTEASVSKTLLNEPNTGKESLKSIYYYCNNCKYRSVTKYALEKHVRSHNEPWRSQSNLEHQTEYHLEDHFHINSKGNLKTQTHSSDKPFACNICTYKCTRKGYLKAHLLTHGDKPFACNMCTYKCTRKSYLKTHLLTHSGNKPFACNICTYKFMHKSSLKTHLLTHSGDKPFACNICTYKSTQKSTLKTHLLTHSGHKPFACNICTYKSVLKSSLKTHLLTHSDEKPFACNICTYKSVYKSSLKTHLLTHGDKPFACNICTYKSMHKSSLKRHLLTHSDDKKFACNICTYKCTQKSYLKEHFLTHSGDKPFACNLCTYKSTQKSHLISHLMIHTGDKPFACNICTYKCTHKSNLKRHLSTHSSDKSFVDTFR